MAKRKNDLGEEYDDGQGQDLSKLDDAQVTHPPGFSEGVGPTDMPSPVAGEVRKEVRDENARLAKIGVRPIEGTTRGQNVKPEGHHAPEPRLPPTKPEPMTELEDGEYQMQTGEKIPAKQLNSPKMQHPNPIIPGIPVPPPPSAKK